MIPATAHLEIPQDILDSARLTASQLLVELAVYLYAQGRLSLGKAHELAGCRCGSSGRFSALGKSLLTLTLKTSCRISRPSIP